MKTKQVSVTSIAYIYINSSQPASQSARQKEKKTACVSSISAETQLTLGADKEHKHALAIRVELFDPGLTVLGRRAPVQPKVHVALSSDEALRGVSSKIGRHHTTGRPKETHGSGLYYSPLCKGKRVACLRACGQLLLVRVSI